eukprot:12210976-Karenia_brevis.AAC.1
MPQPMLDLLHGLSGAGKAEVLQRLRSCRKYERGVHFVAAAYSSAIADKIGGFTMRGDFSIEWKMED